ncbi:MAG: tetratricopeptide repeat protein [Planctomycetota bacterium]
MNCPQDFLQTVRPWVEAHDPSALEAKARKHWSEADLGRWLRQPEAEVRQMAALVLAMIGGGASVGPLARALHDQDPAVVELAEHALWSVWFRLGCCSSAKPFERGVARLAEDDYPGAVALLTEAIAADPSFAEAYNQRSLAKYLSGADADALEDARAAVARMPSHFGALCGIGHCQAHLARYPEAIASYERALTVHPRMPCIEAAVDRLRRRAAKAG